MRNKTTFDNSSLVFRAFYPLLRIFIGVALKVLSPRLKITGRKNLPRRGSVILAPNHLSDIDPVLIGSIPRRPVCFMAKKELFDIPILGAILHFVNAFPVEPSSPDRTALRQAETHLKAGRQVVIFPEGECSQNGQMQPLLSGVALLALRCNIPVIPVGIINSNKIIPYGDLTPKFTWEKVSVHFAPPLQMEDLLSLPSRQARKLLNERLEQALRDLISL